MRGVWLFVHILGFTLWIGGGIATMVAGITAKGFAPPDRLAVYRAIGAIQRILVFWGAVLVVGSGFPLTMPYMSAGVMPGWLNLMMGAGIAGAILALGVSVPTAARLARLELDPRGEMPEVFQGLRKRQILVASLAGGLGLVAMVAATIGRY